MSDDVVLASGLLAFGFTFLLAAALYAVLRLAKRFNFLQRRHAYETECMVKAIQALEAQHQLATQRLGALLVNQQRMQQEMDGLKKRLPPDSQSNAEPVAALPPRILH